VQNIIITPTISELELFELRNSFTLETNTYIGFRQLTTDFVPYNLDFAN